MLNLPKQKYNPSQMISNFWDRAGCVLIANDPELLAKRTTEVEEIEAAIKRHHMELNSREKALNKKELQFGKYEAELKKRETEIEQARETVAVAQAFHVSRQISDRKERRSQARSVRP